ncbi:MAG: transcriptional repressor [Chloroflexi bacterium]|nr:transcriptional repressor [Chloroflexota bacterium]
MRNTYQRQVILEELVKVKSHPQASEVYEMVRRRIPSISFGTVYRNLRLLRDKGLIQELTLGKHASRWDGDVNSHYHFTCESCGVVYDMDYIVSSPWDQAVEKETGFHVTGHRAEFYGYCKNCRGKKALP